MCLLFYYFSALFTLLPILHCCPFCIVLRSLYIFSTGYQPIKDENEIQARNVSNKLEKPLCTYYLHQALYIEIPGA